MVHLYLGFSAGAALVLIGLTGSILVFHLEIDEWLNPQLLRVVPQPGGESAYRPIDEITGAAMRVMPEGSQMTFGQYPRHDAVAYRWNVLIPSVPNAKAPMDFELHHVFVNPYSAEVIGSRLVRPVGLAGAVPRTFIGFVFALHYALLLPRMGDPPFGDTVVAILGMVLISSLFSGLYLWWPRRGGWRSALTIKRKAHVRRLNFDLHKTAGVYFAIVLLGIFVSGVYLNLRAPFHAVVRLFSPTVDRFEIQSHVLPGHPSISLGEAMHAVESHSPGGRTEWLYLPKKPTGTYTVCQRDVEGLSVVLSRRCVVVDRYSGQILHVQSPERGTAGEYFIQWQWPVHSGQAFGMTGRWTVFASGLICPLLFGTGGYLWWRKRDRGARSA
jgi:uncharacterized iron-regulated membrane protein